MCNQLVVSPVKLVVVPLPSRAISGSWRLQCRSWQRSGARRCSSWTCGSIRHRPWAWRQIRWDVGGAGAYPAAMWLLHNRLT